MEPQPFSIEPSQPHTHTVVFLHGRGDNVPNFVRALGRWVDSRGRNLAQAFPSFRWVFPQAPTRACVGIPGTTWPQWFDVWSTKDFKDREELQAQGLREVVPHLRDLIAAEAARLGGRWDRVVLAGISMGGATGSHVLFNLDVPPEGGGRLAAFVAVSCRLPFYGRVSLAEMRAAVGVEGAVPDHDRVVRNTPVLHEHCVDDPLIMVEHGRRMRQTLAGFGAQVVAREYPTGGHWFNTPQGADDVIAFLKAYVHNSDTDAGASSGPAPLTMAQAFTDPMDLT